MNKATNKKSKDKSNSKGEHSAMSTPTNKSSERVKKALESHNFGLEIVQFDASTRTAADAAATIGCGVHQIVKSLIFKGKTSGDPLLIVASGINRVNEKTVKSIIGEKLGKADADFVREHTGYAIGGVPPLGHIKKIKTFIDEDLLNYEELWAAAGTPNSVFRLTPTILQEITGGQVISIK